MTSSTVPRVEKEKARPSLLYAKPEGASFLRIDDLRKRKWQDTLLIDENEAHVRLSPMEGGKPG